MPPLSRLSVAERICAFTRGGELSCELQRAASIEDQARNCRKRADPDGWEIIVTFADAAGVRRKLVGRVGVEPTTKRLRVSNFFHIKRRLRLAIFPEGAFASH